MRPSEPRLPSVLRVMLATALGLSCLANAAHPAKADTPTIVVLDGSGSMWGKMTGNETAKFYAARDHLRRLIGQAPPQSRIGLASFGHRRKGDCGDIEVIAPPEVGGAERVIAALDKLNPKGKGPIADSLVAAAAAIGEGAAGSIVLVHDSLDNCQKDVCSAAGAVAKTNPGLAIHVLSLGLAPGEAPRMSCVAKLTGGRHLEAYTESEIGTALTQVFDLAALEPVVPGAQPPPPPQPQAAAPASGPPGLRLTATLAPGGSMLDRPVLWVIRNTGASAEAAPLVERKSAEINEPVPPGSYRIVASLGLVSKETTLEVGPQGPTVAALTLDAGTLSIAATASAAGQPLSAPVASVIRKPSDTGGPAATPIWIGRDASAELVVPAGQYDVEVVDGVARKSVTVTVPSGGVGQASLVLETGELALSSVGHVGGSPLSGTTYVLEVDDTESSSGRRELVRSAAPAPKFTLVAGTYYVTAMLGPNTVRDRVAVGIGDKIDRQIVMGVSRVTFEPRVAGANPPAGLPIAVRVFETQGDKRLVARSTEPRPVVTLAAGQYRIEAQLGTSNVRASRLMDVSAGRDLTIGLELEAAELRPETLVESIPLVESRAVIRDTRGRTVWRARPGTQQATLLAPGRYVLTYDDNGSRKERTIDIGAAPAIPDPVGDGHRDPAPAAVAPKPKR